MFSSFRPNVMFCLCVCAAGFHVIHSVVNILLIYVVLITTGGTSVSVILAFVINMVRMHLHTGRSVIFVSIYFLVLVLF